MGKACELPLKIEETTFRMIECVCGRRYVAVAGDGMITPPRLYWKQVRRLHLRRYWDRHA